MDAINLLTQDHRKVESLFLQGQHAQEAVRRNQIFMEIFQELSLHAIAEEEELYPKLANFKETAAKAQEAFEEHVRIKTLLAEISNATMQKCIEDCLNCYAVCTATISHCLEMGGTHADLNHIRLMLDCAKICQTSADFMLRGSNNHLKTCQICAKICEMCAKDCERLAQGDQHMQACTDACRKCAQSCQQMITMEG
jgi:hypothetical protein